MDRNPEADRRLMWALVLTMIVMYAWSTWFAPKPPPPDQSATTEQAAPTGATSSRPAVSAPPSDSQATATAQDIPERKLTFKADGFDATLDSRGGALTLPTLTAYQSEPTVTPIWRWVIDKFSGKAPSSWRPYEGGGDPARLFGEPGAIAVAGAGEIDGATPYEISESGDALVARRALPSGLVVTKTFKKGEQPFVTQVEVRFENQGTAPVAGLWVGVLDEAHKLQSRFDNTFLPVAYADGSLQHVKDPADLMGDKRTEHEGPLSWFGFGNRYFMGVLLPQDGSGLRLVFDELSDGRIGAFAYDDAPLAPGQSRTLSLKAYLGPKDLGMLEKAGNDLDEAVEFGFFGFFSKVLLMVLQLYHGFFGNWGLAILVLTITVKAAFFPLTQKSLASSRRMQLIQPQLKALQEKYKDDPARQQQETMKLFSENNVNPLGGCLPMLFQLPVWFGLYSCLLYSVELYNSSFVFIHDLTAADPYAVLPTIAGVLFYVQQTLTPMTGVDPAQAKMMRFMPVIFAVFLYNLPSGLVFYMVTNAILSIAQTWFLNRTMPARTATA